MPRISRLALCALSMCAVIQTGTAFAEPTVAQVNEAIQLGQYARAETLLHEVLPHHPHSGLVHYLLADVLSREGGHKEEAMHQLQTARTLSPGLPFAQPQDVARIEAGARSASPLPVAPELNGSQEPSPFSLVWLVRHLGMVLSAVGLLLLAILAAAFAVVKGRRTARGLHSEGGNEGIEPELFGGPSGEERHEDRPPVGEHEPARSTRHNADDDVLDHSAPYGSAN